MNSMINYLMFMLMSFTSSWTSHGAAALFIGDTLRPGEALNSSSFMVSASGEFTLGFNSGYLTLKSNKNYTVWVANLYSPISDTSSALLTLDVKNKTELLITLEGNKPVILHSSLFFSANAVATLTDSGNLVLQEVDQNVSKPMGVLWQSFDEPNVALMPEMKLLSGGILCWQESQPSTEFGSFSLRWDFDTLQLQILSTDIYRFYNVVIWSGGFGMMSPDESKVKYNFSVDDEGFFSYNVVGDQNVRSTWVLHSDGELYDVYNNISIVRAGDCDGFNTGGGCQRWGPGMSDYCGYGFSSTNDSEMMKHGFFEPLRFNISVNSSWVDSNPGNGDCKQTCWSNCDCLGFDYFLFDNQTVCRFWSIRHSHFLEDPASPTTAFVLPRKPRISKPGWIVNGIAIAVALLALVLCSLCYLIRTRKLAGENQRKIQEMLNMMNSNRPTNANGLQNDGKRGHDLSVFSYASIAATTCNFSDRNKLGEGGFGPVYKGKLLTGQEVAVKRLSKRSGGQGISEFKNELILIYELQHTNLVQLFGFCIHGEELILIYEYMANKSLDYFLFDSTRCQHLDWNKRFNIIEGIAQGLLYLHKYSRTRIIHRDLKASNVLLDEKMNPKISDFGLARIVYKDEEEANTTKIVGTRGYMSPEYVIGGKFSTKSDVYSFGVLMLEILSGRKNNSFYNDDRAINLVGYAWALWKQGAGTGLTDPTIGDSCDKDQLSRCIHVGLLCVEENAANRPTMLDVIPMLTNESMSLPVPIKPAFCTERNVITAAVGGSEPEIVASVNGVSISEFDGR